MATVVENAKKRRDQAHRMRADGATYKEIGNALGISSGRASQLVNRAERAIKYARHFPWSGEVGARTENCLINEGLTSREEVASYSDERLLNIPNFGMKCLAEVRLWLAGEEVSPQTIGRKLNEWGLARAKAAAEQADMKAKSLESELARHP